MSGCRAVGDFQVSRRATAGPCRPALHRPGRHRRPSRRQSGKPACQPRNQRKKVAAAAEAETLSPRDREILKDIIYTHILSGEPVSSPRGVKARPAQSVGGQHPQHHGGPRRFGLLAQPHSSAGRVPTAAAYRLYVGSLMHMRTVSSRERSYIEEYLLDASNDTDHLMSAATHLLSELSDQVGVVLTPSIDEIVLKSLDFVYLGRRRVLCVMVSTTGFLDHLVIRRSRPTSPAKSWSVSRTT